MFKISDRKISSRSRHRTQIKFLITKTLPSMMHERENFESCGRGSWVVTIPKVTEPVVVPVPSTVVPVEVTNIQVAIGVRLRTIDRPNLYHKIAIKQSIGLKSLQGLVSLVSLIYPSQLHQVSSFFRSFRLPRFAKP